MLVTYYYVLKSVHGVCVALCRWVATVSVVTSVPTDD